MDATNSFKIVLEKCGYSDVIIRSAKLPGHIIKWGRGDDTEMTDEEVAETMPYYKVSSGQGSFGIVVAAYNLIDLEHTGFNALDLGEKDAEEDFFLASLNTVTLGHLKKLLEKRKRLN